MVDRCEEIMRCVEEIISTGDLYGNVKTVTPADMLTSIDVIQSTILETVIDKYSQETIMDREEVLNITNNMMMDHFSSKYVE